MSQVRTPVRPGLPSPLADLLGARWTMGVPVTAAAWFDGQDAVGFGLADGTLAITRAQWNGAAMVQPREGGGVELVPARGEPPPAIRARIHAGPCLCVAGHEGVVLSGGRDGCIARTRPDGTFDVLSGSSDGGVGCIATGKGGAWAYAAGHGLDARSGECVDMVAAGIIDPVKVSATALRNAASVAALILTTQTLIADKPDRYDPTAGPALGGGAERLGRA